MSLKTNFIIDGNYMLYRSVFILKKTRTIKQDLKVLLKKDLEKAIDIHPFDNIYFTSDKGKSWRHDIYKEYKGERKKDSSIDWDQVYSDYKEFKEEVNENNRIQVIEQDKLEGDDIIGYIVNESNKKGYSNIILSSDSDLQQLLKYDIKENFINLIWNFKFNDERVYLPRNYQIFMENAEKISEDSNNLFDMNYDNEFLSTIDKLVNRSKIKEVYFEEILFNKIVSGDKKDNITSVIKVKDKKLNENAQGIGESGASKCFKLYQDTYGKDYIDFHSDEFLNQCAEIVTYHKKVNNDEEIKNIVKENIRLNHKLLNIDSKLIPTDLKNKLEKKIHFK